MNIGAKIRKVSRSLTRQSLALTARAMVPFPEPSSLPTLVMCSSNGTI